MNSAKRVVSASEILEVSCPKCKARKHKPCRSLKTRRERDAFHSARYVKVSAEILADAILAPAKVTDAQ